MARPLRLEYPGAVYHVMSRGHERSAIFREDGDREKFHSVLIAVIGDERWNDDPESPLSRRINRLRKRFNT